MFSRSGRAEAQEHLEHQRSRSLFRLVSRVWIDFFLFFSLFILFPVPTMHKIHSYCLLVAIEWVVNACISTPNDSLILLPQITQFTLHLKQTKHSTSILKCVRCRCVYEIFCVRVLFAKQRRHRHRLFIVFYKSLQMEIFRIFHTFNIWHVSFCCV